MLSLAIATVCASLPPPPPVCDPTPAAAAGRPLRFVLVDRSSVRRKADGELREAGVPHTRVKSDIADVSLVKVVELHEGLWRLVRLLLTSRRRADTVLYVCARVFPGPSVMVSKHLCGGATDLALSALASVCSKDSPVNVWGVAIATCCHHKCSWDVYTGKEWFTAQVSYMVDSALYYNSSRLDSELILV